MDNYVAIDPVTHRVLIRAEGQWTRDESLAYHRRMLDVLAMIERTGEPITILADMRGLHIHTAEVARMLEESMAVMARFRVTRHALVIPSFLMRMQARRMVSGLGWPFQFFNDLADARTWLCWERDYSLVAA